MLGTLMKYEFKANSRVLLPAYGAWIIVALLLGLSINFDSADGGWFVVITALLYAFFTIAAVVITAILLIQRFYKNLLGNEGYMMFALPVTTGKHMINKVFSGAIWIVIGVIAAVLSGCAIAISIDGLDSFLDGFAFTIGEFKVAIGETPSLILIIVEAIIVMLVASAQTVVEIYAAIAIGHQWGNHRILGAICAYIGFSIIEGILASLFSMLALTGIFDGIMEAYYNMSAIAQSHIGMIAALLLSAVVTAIYWFVCWILLDKRLNLE